MKRSSAREFAFLTLPIALVAGVGWWASRRPTKQEPSLKARLQVPTVMQSFDGVKTIWVAEVTGGNHQLQRSRIRLEIATAQGDTFWQNDTKGSIATNAFRRSPINKTTDSLKMSDIPAGEVFLNYKAWIAPANDIDTATPIVLEKRWKLDKSRIKSFDSNQPRTPLVQLKSVTVTKIEPAPTRGTVLAGAYINCEAVFVLQGEAVTKNTKLETRFRDSNGWIDRFALQGSEATVRTRVAGFTLDTQPYPWQKSKPKIAVISGLANADNSWPLAFKIEPFDFKTAKVGQQLKFKQWPAPLPPGVNIK